MPDKKDPKECRIMIIEDDDAIREMIQITMEGEGFKVSSSRDGRNIMAKVKNAVTDLVISDVMMPGGGGYDVLRNLQGDPDTAHIPVIVMTGHAFDPSTKHMFEQERNFKAFFQKPIQPQVLLGKVHELLNTISKDEKMIEEQKQNLKDFDLNDFNELR